MTFLRDSHFYLPIITLHTLTIYMNHKFMYSEWFKITLGKIDINNILFQSSSLMMLLFVKQFSITYDKFQSNVWCWYCNPHFIGIQRFPSSLLHHSSNINCNLYNYLWSPKNCKETWALKSLIILIRTIYGLSLKWPL